MLEEEALDSRCMPHLGVVRGSLVGVRLDRPIRLASTKHHEPLIMIVFAFGLGVLVSPET
jgi:hypothetical protein